MAADEKPAKTCTACGKPGGSPARDDLGGEPSGFSTKGDGRLQSQCRACMAAKERARYEARVARINSDFASLEPGDFRVGVGNTGERKDEHASEEKRQEWSVNMGKFAEGLHQGQGDPDAIDPDLGGYLARLAEQERRFGNRRIARSVSLAAAHETLHLRQLRELARDYLSDRVVPAGYATLKPEGWSPRRTVVCGLSDLHLGSDIKALDNPRPFGAIEEARRLEFVLRQVIDFKPQYREVSDLVLLLNGDLIEGLLGWDLRDGAPLAEQKLIFWRHFRLFVGICAAHYKRVRAVCEPGNHGRDKVRHPGRASSRKWDGHEWEMMWALKEMCSGLLNVEWDIPYQAVAVVDLHGSKGLVTHGDTEVKLGDPDVKARENSLALDRINSTREYGVEFDWCFTGHYHKPRYIPGRVRHVWNAALVPPNGHARGNGHISEPCGQWVWEAVPGHPVGDLRFVEVGRAQDEDERLGKLIPPFRIEGVQV